MEDARNLSLQQRAIVHRKRNACLYKGNYKLARKSTHLLTSLHSDCLMQFNAIFTYRLLSLSNWYAKTLTSSCVPTILRFCDAIQCHFDTSLSSLDGIRRLFDARASLDLLADQLPVFWQNNGNITLSCHIWWMVTNCQSCHQKPQYEKGLCTSLHRNNPSFHMRIKMHTILVIFKGEDLPDI